MKRIVMSLVIASCNAGAIRADNLAAIEHVLAKVISDGPVDVVQMAQLNAELEHKAMLYDAYYFPPDDAFWILYNPSSDLCVRDVGEVRCK